MRNLILSTLLLIVSCTSGSECGPGTTEIDGSCVPSAAACGPGATFNPLNNQCESDAVTCARGTTEEAGTCVPDGSVICSGSTTYQASSGTCVLDPSGCATGTVLVGAQCVPFDETLEGDLNEAPEPNHPEATPGTLTPPIIGRTVTIDGCIIPVDLNIDGQVDIDMDAWVFTVTEPSAFDITIDGIGGASAGFALFSADPQMSEWLRIGASLVSDGARRLVYLPRAGTYVLIVSDARSMFLSLPAGGPEACYFLQMTGVSIPPATTLSGQATGVIDGPKFFTTEVERNQITVVNLSAPIAGVLNGLVLLHDGTYLSHFQQIEGADHIETVLTHTSSGTITLVVDPVYDLALEDTPFTLQATTLTTIEADGASTLTHQPGQENILHFDAVADDVVRLELTESTNAALNVTVYGPAGATLLSPPCGSCTVFDSWLQITQTGRHFVSLVNLDGTAGVDYTVNVNRTHVTPQDLTVGNALSATLVGRNRDFFRIDVDLLDWVLFEASNPTNVTNIGLTFFGRGTPGALGTVVGGLDGGQLDFGRIYVGDRSAFLVMAENNDGHAGNETFTLTMQSRDFTDLGQLTTEINRQESLSAGALERYLVRADAETSVTVTVDATVDLVLTNLGRDESVVEIDATASGAETLTLTVEPYGFVAFTVRESTGAATSFTLQVAAR